MAKGIFIPDDKLNLLNQSGLTQDKIQSTVNAYRSEGLTDDVIQDKLNNKIIQLEMNNINKTTIDTPTKDNIVKEVTQQNKQNTLDTQRMVRGLPKALGGLGDPSYSWGEAGINNLKGIRGSLEGLALAPSFLGDVQEGLAKNKITQWLPSSIVYNVSEKMNPGSFNQGQDLYERTVGSLFQNSNDFRKQQESDVNSSVLASIATDLLGGVPTGKGAVKAIAPLVPMLDKPILAKGSPILDKILNMNINPIAKSASTLPLENIENIPAVQTGESTFNAGLEYNNQLPPDEINQALDVLYPDNQQSIAQQRAANLGINPEDVVSSTIQDQTLFDKYGPEYVRDQLVNPEGLPLSGVMDESKSTILPGQEYETITNLGAEDQAQRLIDNNPEFARDFAANGEAGATKAAVQKKIMQQLIKDQQNESLANFTIDVVKGRREVARELQYSFGDLTPEDALMVAQRVTEKSRPKNVQEALEKESEVINNLINFKSEKEKLAYLNMQYRKISKPNRKPLIAKIINLYNAGTLDSATYRQAFADKFKIQNLTPELQQQIIQQAETLQSLPKGSRERDVAEGLLLKTIVGQTKASLLKKVATVQTMAQLLNPKTTLRNIIGNTSFNTVDVGTKGLLAPQIDKLLALRSGQRSIVPTKVKALIEGGNKGIKEGLEDTRLGINTSQFGSQYDLPQPDVFNSKFMNNLQKGLNYTLQVPDRGFSQAIFDESIANQLKVAELNGLKLNSPTKEMIEQATNEAKQATFQDDNVLSQGFVGLKRILNANKEFGAGDILFKYPKTPANLLARSLDYSPIGLVKGAMNIDNNQRQAAIDLSRGIVGTGIIGAGYGLNKSGILTGSGPEKTDKTLRANLMASGWKPNALNIGDTYIDTSWMLPLSVNTSIGAALNNKSAYDSSTGILDSVAGGLNTIVEQPLMTGVQRAFNPYGDGGIAGNIAETALQAPASFTPSILRQITQSIDPNVKDTYSTNALERFGLNPILKSLPGMLPNKLDVTGKPISMNLPESNKALNVLGKFFNPANMSQESKNPALREALNLYKETGEKGQLFGLAPRFVVIDGDKKNLSTKQRNEWTLKYSKIYNKQIMDLINNKDYQDLTPEKKIEVLEKRNRGARAQVKKEIFGVK